VSNGKRLIPRRPGISKRSAQASQGTHGACWSERLRQGSWVELQAFEQARLREQVQHATRRQARRPLDLRLGRQRLLEPTSKWKLRLRLPQILGDTEPFVSQFVKPADRCPHEIGRAHV